MTHARDDLDLLCTSCNGMRPHRWRPSLEAGPSWQCSECGYEFLQSVAERIERAQLERDEARGLLSSVHASLCEDGHWHFDMSPEGSCSLDMICMLHERVRVSERRYAKECGR